MTKEPIMHLEQTPRQPVSTNTHKKPMNIFIKIYVVAFGILLPLITLIYELSTNGCAETFFDPIPTYLHVMMVALVPLANLLIFIGMVKKPIVNGSKHGFMNGITIGISTFYTLLFLPLLPLSVVAITFMGLGLLPLSPLLSLVAGLFCRRALKIQFDSKVSGLWWGIAVALSLFVVAEVPTTLTRYGMKMAVSESESTRLRGIRLLRNFGSQEVMLRMCYQRPGMATDIVGFVFSIDDPVLPSDARKVFYQVKGIPFNSMAPPKMTQDRFMFDENLGGEEVAGKIRGLSLTHSRMDGSIDSDAALSYTEWTLIFKNATRRQQEARALVALPPSGVVSRLTLWIDGEEREAAFAKRLKVKQAYQAVVSQRRDPVLITTKGPDRILVQCFPVQPGKEMKIRFGITAPLYLNSRDKAFMLLPHFIEHNFKIPDPSKHHLWLESKNPIQTINKGLITENPQKDLYAVRGEISNQQLVEDKALIQITPFSLKENIWTEDPLSNGKSIIRQCIFEKEMDKPSHVLFVIDGSIGMQPYIEDIIKSLKQFPSGMTAGIIVAGDQSKEIVDRISLSDSQSYDKTVDRLGHIKFQGGCDNVRALGQAWEWLAHHRNSAIVWIHSAQPVELTSTESLIQKWERRPQSPVIYDIQVNNGPNLVLQKLDHFKYVVKIPIINNPGQELEQLFKAWSVQGKRLHFMRKKSSMDSIQNLDAALQTSDHLARLWAFERIKALSFSEKKADINKAIALAMDYQLVTPVSGAVVLENERQYSEAGLKPADPSTVPTIPEPEVWMLLTVVFLILSLMLYKKGHTWQRS